MTQRRRVTRVRKTQKKKEVLVHRKTDIKGFAIYDLHEGKVFQRGSFENASKETIREALELYDISIVVGLANAEIEAMRELADAGEGEYIYNTIPDGDITEDLKFSLLGLAILVADKIREGGKSLIYCNAGRNRSGLLNALIIRNLTGCTGEEAMQKVRERRPRAIANGSFESFLAGLKSPTEEETGNFEPKQPKEPEVEIIEEVLESVPASGDRLFKVCLDWDLRIPDYVMDVSQGQLDKYRGKVELMPYSHLLHKRIVDAGYGAWCYQAAMEFLLKSDVEVKKVAEYCAGVGRTTTIIQNMLEPIEHFAADINQEHCRHLVSAFPKVQVTCANYKEMQKQLVDLSCIDNNSFTALKFMDPKHGQTDHIKDIINSSKFTLITDTAKSRFHLNKERYANLLGGEIEDEHDYIMLYSINMWKLAKASVVFVASHPRASYILFQRDVKPGAFETVQAPTESKFYFYLADGERELSVTEEEAEDGIKVGKVTTNVELSESPTANTQEDEDDSEIMRMRDNLLDKPDSQPDIPDIEDEDIFDKGGELKVVIVMAGGGAAGKSTASKAFAVGDPEDICEPGAWLDRKDKRNIGGVNICLYDNYALAGNHKSGTDSNQAPDLVRLATWRALGERDIVIVDGFASSPQWVTALNNWPGKTPIHVLLIHFDLDAEDLMDRLESRRGVSKETFRGKMYPKCAGLVRRAELLVGHFEADCTRPLTKLMVDKFMSPEDIVASIDDKLDYIFNEHGLDYDDMRS